MAPEMLLAKGGNPTQATEKVDSYSFGILLWEIVTKEKAFTHHSSFTQFKACILRGERPPSRHPSLTDPLRNLLNYCWAPRPNDRPTMAQVVEKLELIQSMQEENEGQDLVRQDISDEMGHKFWSHFFNSRSAVHWEKFAEPFWNYMNSQTGSFNQTPLRTEMRCLKALLVDSGEIVHRNIFGKVIGWFGPLQFPRTASPFGMHMMDTICNTLKLPYFHGKLSGQEADSLLSTEKPGTFLVRFSGNHPNSLCLSYNDTDHSVKHVVIRCEHGSFMFSGKPYKSVDLLARAAATEYLKLDRFVTTSQWEHLFAEEEDIETNSGYVTKD
jgi:hypothetical protein